MSEGGSLFWSQLCSARVYLTSAFHPITHSLVTHSATAPESLRSCTVLRLFNYNPGIVFQLYNLAYGSRIAAIQSIRPSNVSRARGKCRCFLISSGKPWIQTQFFSIGDLFRGKDTWCL